MKRALAERAKQETEEQCWGSLPTQLSGQPMIQIPSSPPLPGTDPQDQVPVSHSKKSQAFDDGVPLVLNPVTSIAGPGVSNKTTLDGFKHGSVTNDDIASIILPSVFPPHPTTPPSESMDTRVVTAETPKVLDPAIKTKLSSCVTHSSLPQSTLSMTTAASVDGDKSPTQIVSSALSSLNKVAKKRSRPYAPPLLGEDIDNDGGDDTSELMHNKGFYLLHQNRALASELFHYKQIIKSLEEERFVRRQECKKISDVLGSMSASWNECEAMVLGTLKKKLCTEKNSQDPVENLHLPSLVTSFSSLHAQSSAASTSDTTSTGAGLDVEAVSNIIDALTNVSKSPFFSNSETAGQSSLVKMTIEDETSEKVTTMDKMEDDSVQDAVISDAESSQMKMLAMAAITFSDRCCRFQSLVSQLLRLFVKSHVLVTATYTNASVSPNSSAEQLMPSESAHRYDENLSNYCTSENEIFQIASLHKQVTIIQNSCIELENQLQELANARDAAIESERRVRRALYRLASGRLKMKEVLELIEKSNSSLSDADLNSCKVETNTVPSIISSNVAASTTAVDSIDVEGELVRSSDILLMKKRLIDLEEARSVRDKHILELSSEHEKAQQQINELMSKGESRINSWADDDIKRTQCYQDCHSKLSVVSKERDSLKSELDRVMIRWSVTKGDLSLARKTIDELVEKHQRRWKELVSPDVSSTSSESTGTDATDDQAALETNEKEHVVLAKKITELEHKLKHALDNVRHCENLRTSLTDATEMNDIYQTKLEELKVKNAALMANKAAARNSAQESVGIELSQSRTIGKEEQGMNIDQVVSGSTSVIKDDKAVRKLKKELSAAILSKDQAKAKQERAEKERDHLMKMNTRLVKQCTEKEDINTKSLTTIFHLKQISEKLEQEKDVLEKKLKAVEQLALAARLATNAKERVEEEFHREREAMKKEFDDLKQQMDNLYRIKGELEDRVAHADVQVDIAMKDLAATRQRCDDLVSHCCTADRELMSLKEELAISRKEVFDALNRITLSTSSQKGATADTIFTTEALTAQVSHLKGRLTCPVCNTRDKQVILVRCRHMFCRYCVDTSIKNRSRKCPACAQRFDMKDVGDIWL